MYAEFNLGLLQIQIVHQVRKVNTHSVGARFIGRLLFATIAQKSALLQGDDSLCVISVHTARLSANDFNF